MEKYNITGMSCAACSARVEKAVSEVMGVTECSVNLLTNSMIVEGTANSFEIIAAVENAGYGASKDGTKKENTDISGKEQLKKVKLRLVSSVLLLIVALNFSMAAVESKLYYLTDTTGNVILCYPNTYF